MTDAPELRPAADPEAGAPGDAATAAPAAPDASSDGPVPAGILPADPSPEALSEADASLLALVDRLAGLLERSDLLELEVESGGTGIVLRKPGALAPVAAVAAPAPRPGDAAAAPPADPAPAPAPADAAAVAPAANRAAVLAPLTGIFYASSSPGSPPFVEVGREVVVGQVIGLIEAMKLFNEIKSDKAGRVVRVIPENGTLVKAKHPLIEVEPL
jgi:acetyl-CoA carboxylase biotin carboxyl carrier protein